ncbi:unnamed protein product [Orchesella dallaii]|uniref:N-terminal acetyltransferase B complex subunit MDM20 homolog n=1 Tax=Orchesella dallaii TaxID=48710 RepID=A0ABP1RL75_9HEXA
MSGGPNAETWVRERRLRPIYELLDSGNNKKVIAEVDRVMKKNPTFTCAKVLKALALIRMNKTNEARGILKPVLKEVPTDDGTIQALSICYRELDEPITLCNILEAACKKEQSEELLTHCFMAQVRTNEYSKQHLTAINLYKAYTKPTYFGWAVASLLIKAEKLQDDSARISVPLAERMLSKFIKEQKNQVEDNILILYLETLKKQKKWEEVLKVLKDHGYPQPTTIWNNDYFYEAYTQAMIELDRKTCLYEYLHACYMKNMDEYHLIERIITLFKNDDEGKESVKTLMGDIRVKYPSYVVALADLLYCKDHSKDDDWNIRIREDLQMACTYGAEKPSFYSDIVSYVYQFKVGTFKSEFLDFLGPNVEPVAEYDSVGKIIRDVNYELLDRELDPDNSPIKRMERAHRCLEKYFIGESVVSSFRSDENLRTKEADYHDMFLVIAASTLMAKYDEDVNDFEGVLQKVKSSEQNFVTQSGYKNRATKEKIIEIDNDNIRESYKSLSVEGLSLQEPQEPYILTDEHYLLTAAILLMEFGLKQCPYNHSLRILLIKAYNRIGAVDRACKVAQGLDIKHIQYDSLGYMIIWKMLRGGMYQEVTKMLTIAENVYTNYKRESMEHVITTYKYGTFTKIPEFMAFREMLLNSCQYYMVAVEKRFLEYYFASPSDFTQIAKTIQNDISREEVFDRTSAFSDNRDFTVFQFLESEPRLETLKEASCTTDVLNLKTRNALMFAITDLIILVDHPEFVSIAESRIKLIDESINVVKTNMENMSQLNNRYNDVPNFDGIWPAMDSIVVECLSVLLELISGVRKAILKVEITPLVTMKNSVSGSWKSLMKRLHQDLKNLNILTIGRCIESVHHVTETLTLACILFNVCIKVIKKQTDARNTRKKKKAASAADGSASKKKHFESLWDAISSLREHIQHIQTSVNRTMPYKWTTVEQSWEGLLGENFKIEVFSKFFGVVHSGIADSYTKQLDQFIRVIDNNTKLISLMEKEIVGLSTA